MRLCPNFIYELILLWSTILTVVKGKRGIDHVSRQIKRVFHDQGCSPKILTRGALYKRSWALPKRKSLIFRS